MERDGEPTGLQKGGGPRDVFLYLLSFLALYLSVIGFVVLAWGVIEELIEDPLRPAYGSSSPIRAGLSMLVVAFPLFFYLTVKIRRGLEGGDMDGSSLLRKVLIYFTLFVISVTAAVDLIVVIYLFLGGELSARTFLKALSVFVAMALVFAHSKLDLAEAKAGR